MTLEQIFNQTYSDVLNHVKRVVKHQHDAEDVSMDVYIKIQKLMDKESTRFDENKSSLSTWVHTVTNSVILDFFRTNHQDKYQAVSNFVADDEKEENKVYFHFVAPSSANADQKVFNDEFHKRVRKAFSTLKPKYRMIAKLYFLNDLPYNEIAELLDIPMGSVKGMLSRARAKLQTELQGFYGFKSGNVQSVEA